MHKNKIAFLITIYKNDKLDFFQKSIKSILDQTYGFDNINIYLGIDGKLPAILNQYIEKNKNLFYKIIYNETNKGLAYTLNRLIEQLENEEYIFRMDSDDICHKDRVVKQIEFLEKNSDVMVVGSNLIEIDENDNELRHKNMPIEYENIINYAIVRSPLNHPSVAIRKDFFKIVGLYNEEFLKSQDYELWARALMKNVKIDNLCEYLLYFRIPSDYLRKRSSKASYKNEYKVSISLMKHFNKYCDFPKIILKYFIRISPSWINALAYKIIRKKDSK